MSRRKRHRRKPEQTPAEPTTSEPRDLTDAERRRLLQRFSNMRGRAVVFGVAPIGPVVEASNPAEMVEKTDAAIVEATLKQRPS